MAWHGSDRRSRLPADWPARRVAVLKRDGYRCVAQLDTGARCVEAGTDVDHIRPGDDHDYVNLQTLCWWHHRKKTAQEAAEARSQELARRPSRRRPQRRHPGEL